MNVDARTNRRLTKPSCQSLILNYRALLMFAFTHAFTLEYVHLVSKVFYAFSSIYRDC
ncbi:hypothetical protein MBAV_003920 [Candidatus Magnetobacterium bavaricum]|uniref:Uncharacterized protein n=1 Tax=Candidatus Magnetobacterium bavaricum TaxID=29290 RepID=A0A0F3GPR8_9BACT|nr:hypothetical protein MBAV_003920 [Candidatus Magnetobacterium bavaricum]